MQCKKKSFTNHFQNVYLFYLDPIIQATINTGQLTASDTQLSWTLTVKLQSHSQKKTLRVWQGILI